ncbi:methyl coenzyme M reductase system, component A2 [Methanosphaerula palustris]|uniref:Methyl coenzyme M reductase system, component A2 n=1 Tax=Methanosphaerula palustris (strain ATCC BAA-1556 / DSM 19958 / E1-9c) TaxID=521011 RepID=B8GJ66_METPE|nr:methyl coenzyme M reductase system, component A2 [Methanosphaerula palustris]ACL15639.1 methyl coenzyme M reductase system, component A2 [Methanosphaerula palustris E1-9c]
MTPLITIQNLCMDFEGKRVLNNISFSLAEAEIVGIIGRSGAGKTVLMHLIRGVDEPPTSGSIIYHIARCETCDYVDVQSKAGSACPHCGGVLQPQDVDLWAPDNEALKRRIMNRTAIMFQRSFALYGNDRVIENVLHALDDINYPSEKAVNRAADLLDEVRLSHRMMHIARDLSGGEKQRVVLARQLAREPYLLLADEPTGTLDPETAGVVHKMLKGSVESGEMGMIVTSHFSSVIEDVADRAILLADGAITAIGTPKEVIETFMKDYSDVEQFEQVKLGEKILMARDIEKRYISVDRGVVRAVNGVTFDVSRGEIFGIIGKSGAGKTTLSRIIAGVVEPTAGEMAMKVGDEWIDMTKPGIEFRGRAKSYIGLLHQEYDLYPHRTVIDNLTDAIGLEFPKELAVRKAVVTLKMAGFTEEKSREILDRLPGHLSEGERHRVAMAQVLIREPSLVILDEPTGTIDPITKIDVKHSILHAREGIDETFVIVSHDMEFVRDICDRVALMRGGKIIEIGETSAVLAHLTEDERQVMDQPGSQPGQ